ncbi:sulfotransferase domain-containing protein [Pelagibius litoralis]|uniref:Sulfotransferase domain-containing protein n=1 Tax=Pelagibius litoralis TaxID=374515 RepID=A0A967KFZ4_9PROT|nr:sulfotransferase domain-containing protein [Pelagibius litoralis]NIA71685.1 sulfotransferase domain-containing protein [Pelagibius litoralis]
MPGILWLASYPKSGNTWMRVFLANVILGEEKPLALQRINEVCSSEPNEVWFAPLTKAPPGQLSDKKVAALRTKAQERAASLNRNILPMKTHSFLGKDYGYPTISVKASVGVIYIVRDPRDVAISAADHYGLTIDQAIEMMRDKTTRGRPMAGNTVYERMGSWSDHVKSWTGWRHSPLIVLRYEDMLADPLRQLGGVARKLGVTRDDAKIARAVEFSSFKVLQAQEEQTGFVEKSVNSQRFFRSGRSGGWREKLSPSQAAEIGRDHAVQMKRFGYL